MLNRSRVYEVLERSKMNDRLGRRVDAFLIVLIIANVMAAILETVPRIEQAWAGFFWRFEVVSVLIFTVEYVLRVWSCVEAPDRSDGNHWRARGRYLFTWGAVVDLMAILPFYLTVFLNLDLRMLRILRLLRLFKLTRYSSAFTMLTEVMRREAATLLVWFVILCVMLVVAASGAYLVERHAQPVDFGSIPEAMWWAMATLSTVGYGEVVPVTLWGKLLGGLIMAIGIGMAALPAGILAAGLSSELTSRRLELKKRYLKALVDGQIAAQEVVELEDLRQELGLSKSDAVEAQERARMIMNSDRVCPHCGGDLSKHLL